MIIYNAAIAVVRFGRVDNYPTLPRKMNQDQIAYIIKDVLHALIYLQVIVNLITNNVDVHHDSQMKRKHLIVFDIWRWISIYAEEIGG